MLALMLRVLSMVRLVGTVQEAKLRAQIAARNAAQLALLCLIAAVLGFLALLFLLLALFLALSSVWPPHWAAFAVFVLLIAIAGLVVLLAQQQRHRRVLPAAPRPLHAAHATRSATGDVEELLGEAQGKFRKHPVALSLGAVMVGLIIGLWGGGRR
jgi:cytochrome bd-type quinol oxidase subunit 2